MYKNMACAVKVNKNWSSNTLPSLESHWKCPLQLLQSQRVLWSGKLMLFCADMLNSCRSSITRVSVLHMKSSLDFWLFPIWEGPNYFTSKMKKIPFVFKNHSWEIPILRSVKMIQVPSVFFKNRFVFACCGGKSQHGFTECICSFSFNSYMYEHILAKAWAWPEAQLNALTCLYLTLYSVNKICKSKCTVSKA